MAKAVVVIVPTRNSAPGVAHTVCARRFEEVQRRKAGHHIGRIAPTEAFPRATDFPREPNHGLTVGAHVPRAAAFDVAVVTPAADRSILDVLNVVERRFGLLGLRALQRAYRHEATVAGDARLAAHAVPWRDRGSDELDDTRVERPVPVGLRVVARDDAAVIAAGGGP